MISQTNIRPSPLAGQWYPADPDILTKRIDHYLAGAENQEIPGKIIGLVSPHAGHRYSGPVAGHAYRTLQGTSIDFIIIVSPMHHPHTAPILTTEHTSFRTPLGEAPVDRGALDHLNKLFHEESGVPITPVERDREHAVEIQLPFLQRVLPAGFTFLPLMIRDQAQRLMHILGNALADTLSTRNGILIASTDLSHFYPAEQAQKLDQTIINYIENLDPEGIYRAEKKKEGFACGKGALSAVLWAAKSLGANYAQHLHYGHSGDITGDTSRVVGYTAAVITQR